MPGEMFPTIKVVFDCDGIEGRIDVMWEGAVYEKG
jgi:hypothetical protein